MATRQSDVNLVIRAKNEATSTVNSVSESLKTLVSNQDSAAASAEALAKGLTDIQKTGDKIAGSANNASQAISRQAKSLIDTRNNADAAAARVDELTRAMGLLQAQSNKKLVGPTIFGSQDDVAVQIKAVKSALSSAQSDVTRFAKTFDTQLAGLRNARAAYTEIADAQVQIRDAVDQVTAAINRQNAASRNAQPLKDINRTTSSVGASSAELSADAFQRAGLTATEKQIAASEAESAAEAKTTAQLAEQARLRQNMAALTAIRNSQYGDSGKSAELSASVFAAGPTKFEQQEIALAKETAAAADAEVAALERVRAVLNPSIAVYANLNSQLAVLRKGMDAGKVSAQEFAAAEQKLTADAKRAAEAVGTGKPQLFGLKPYELQNLGYQVNDVVTQLASGTSLTQTLAQQGGQLLQIFPKVGSSIVAAFKNPYIIGFVATVGAVYLGLKQAADQADRLRDFKGFTGAVANGGDYNAAALAAASKELEHYGVAAKDAGAAVKTFVKDGVNAALLTDFAKASKNLADVFDVDLKQAATEVGQAFTGTYEDISKLDDSYDFLTSAQRDHIRALFDEGKASDARSEAFKLFTAQQEEAANKQRGPWADAVRSLNTLYHSFLDYLANTTFIQGIIKLFDGLADKIHDVSDALAGFFQRRSGVEDAKSQVDTLRQSVAALQADLKNLDGSPERGGTNAQRRTQNALDEAKRQLADAEKNLAAAQAAAPKAGANTDPGENPALRKQSDDTLHDMTLEQQLQNLRVKGEQAVQNLRVRNASFISQADQQHRIALAGELAATKAIGDERVKQAARSKAQDDERQKIQQEQDSYNTAAQSSAIQARQFIISREGFQQKAKFDVNAFRVGFGSDTTTAADGSVNRVTANTTTDITGAIRDLDRRIGEFQDAIKSQIGADRFGSFSSQQQAALTSVAYNYGSLPQRILDAVRHGTGDEISAAIRGLGGDNKGVNRKRRNLEASTFTGSNVALDANTQKQADDLAAAQTQFSAAIADGNEKLAQRTAELEKQAGLTGTALLNAQAQAAADDAELKLQQDLVKTNQERVAQHKEVLTLSQAQIDATRKAASDAVLTPQATLQGQRTDAQRPVDDLTAQADSLQQRIDLLNQNGQSSAASALVPQLDDVNSKLVEAIDNLQKFYKALTPDQQTLLGLLPGQIDTINVGLDQSKIKAEDFTLRLGTASITGKQIADIFSRDVTSAVDGFAQAIAKGVNPITALKDAFLSLASSFLREIAQMIIQQLVFNAVSSLLAGFGGGGSFSASSAPLGGAVSVVHAGGVVGSGLSRSRGNTAAAVFAGAGRFHSGGLPGIAHDEVPAILQKGEEVLSKSDPRNILNGGGKSGGSSGPADVNVKSVIVFDRDSAISEYLNTPAGTKAILGLMRDNSGAVKQAIS